MKYTLALVILVIASNTYAAIDNESYIYADNSEEKRTLKERIRTAENELAEAQLKVFKNNRKVALRGYDNDEVVYKVNDNSKKDIGAKIGMSKEQVINKTYWGKPDNSNRVIDGKDELELWSYKRYGIASANQGLLFFINGKLSHIMVNPDK